MIAFVLIIGVSLFFYDYYMTNSGIKNRVEYEIQKDDVKHLDEKRNRPVRNFLKRLFD